MEIILQKHGFRAGAFPVFVKYKVGERKKTPNILQIRKKRRNFAAANKSICKKISLTY